MLTITLLNVLTVFAGISIFIVFLHMFAAMKRCFGYGTMAGLPILVGVVWAFLRATPEEELWLTVGTGLLLALGIMFVLSFCGAIVLNNKLTASEAENGYRSLTPLVFTTAGCAIYIAAILGFNKGVIGHANFWADAANLEKHAGQAGDGH